MSRNKKRYCDTFKSTKSLKLMQLLIDVRIYVKEGGAP